MECEPSLHPRKYPIIAAAIQVRRVPGCGFLEAVDQAALASNLRNL